MKFSFKKNVAIASMAAFVALSFSACKNNNADSAADNDIDLMAQKIQADSLNQAKFIEMIKPNPDSLHTTNSGLVYVVNKAGTGAKPSATDEVTVHYEGKLLDGTVFDSSYERGEPTSFPLNRVIPGWTEGLQLMQEGAEYIFYIPSELAYGEQGQPQGGIAPNTPLVFKVELIKVGGADKAAAPEADNKAEGNANE